MLKHTQKIKEIYEDIQRKLFYMIPEKWDKLYLYASVIDDETIDSSAKGELFFYYIPKGILKKNPINVYEIPSKFNLEEVEYLKLVDILYERIKILRQEFKKVEDGETWSNLTMSIHNLKFKVDYYYEDLRDPEFLSLERHILWRHQYLGIGLEQLTKQDREILKRYQAGPKRLMRLEHYDAGIYIQDIKNIVDYETENYASIQQVEHIATKNGKPKINQILLLEEEMNRK